MRRAPAPPPPVGGSGQLSTKVTVTSAGSWRWYFPGTTTTARIVSAGDAVALR
ncbi:hypothetical protein AB0J81_34420 [Streptomyces bobili]|uniref:hypothetical protein n=1 Tax=Streptomyces bobili TaxID=67280 RepID=UPI00340A1074